MICRLPTRITGEYIRISILCYSRRPATMAKAKAARTAGFIAESLPHSREVLRKIETYLDRLEPWSRSSERNAERRV